MKCPNCHGQNVFVIDTRMDNRSNTRHRRLRCYNCGFRFNTEERVKDAAMPPKPRKEYRDFTDAGKRGFPTKQQLCWSCQRVYDRSCEWSSDFTPVPGWDATPTEVRASRKGKPDLILSSYDITRCPKYIPDARHGGKNKGGE